MTIIKSKESYLFINLNYRNTTFNIHTIEKKIYIFENLFNNYTVYILHVSFLKHIFRVIYFVYKKHTCS